MFKFIIVPEQTTSLMTFTEVHKLQSSDRDQVNQPMIPTSDMRARAETTQIMQIR